MKRISFFILFSLLLNNAVVSQSNPQMGGWYMYFFSKSFKDSPFGFQGDLQYRNMNIAGDLQQNMLRGGLTFKPKDWSAKFILGYASISSPNSTEDGLKFENRIYQEVLIPNKIAPRVYLTHRFRYEQRLIENVDMRTRFRYNLFMNIALNNTEIVKNTVYLALYNEVFVNGERHIGSNYTVNYFDRNRLYTAIGYALNKDMKFQLGIMNQYANSGGKNQIQLSFHHNF